MKLISGDETTVMAHSNFAKSRLRSCFLSFWNQVITTANALGIAIRRVLKIPSRLRKNDGAT
jgi:hypothetical protein